MGVATMSRSCLFATRPKVILKPQFIVNAAFVGVPDDHRPAATDFELEPVFRWGVVDCGYPPQWNGQDTAIGEIEVNVAVIETHIMDSGLMGEGILGGGIGKGVPLAREN